MIRLFLALLFLLPLAHADSVESGSGVILAVDHVQHCTEPGVCYQHTRLTFRIESSAEPILSTVWLYNDERRLKPGDRVRLGTSMYGTDTGVRHVDQCWEAPPEVEPCVLEKVVSIERLREGEY